MAKRIIQVHPEAEQDILSSLNHYAGIDESLAADLEARIDRAIETVAQRPEIWPTYLHQTRRYLIKRFPFALIYREKEGIIQIVALAHHRRRPGYWRERRL